MNIQRLRNLTTGKLHTKIDHIYEDIEYITGLPGLMTHQIPNAMKAIRPWLKNKIEDQRFWNEEFDTNHTGQHPLPQMTESEQNEMLESFANLPSPLERFFK